MTYIIHEGDNVSISISKGVHIIGGDTFPTARFLITILVNGKLRNIFFEEKLQSGNDVYELCDWNRIHTIHDTLSSLGYDMSQLTYSIRKGIDRISK